MKFEPAQSIVKDSVDIKSFSMYQPMPSKSATLGQDISPRLSQEVRGKSMPFLERTSEILKCAKINAVRSKLFIPSWWVRGVVVKFSNRITCFDAFAGAHLDTTFLAPLHFSFQNIRLFFQILSAVFLSHGDDSHLRKNIDVNISQFVKGTSAQMESQCSDILKIFGSNFQTLRIKSCNRKKGYSIHEGEVLSIVQSCEIVRNDTGVYLRLNFLKSLADFLDPYVLNEGSAQGRHDSFQLTSLTSGILRSFHKRTSSKTILNFLHIELEKRSEIFSAPHWSIFPVSFKSIISAHKSIERQMIELYDHGVLGWNIEPPNMRLRDLKKGLEKKGFGNISHSAFCAHRLSEQMEECRIIEEKVEENVQAHKNEIKTHSEKKNENFSQRRTAQLLSAMPQCEPKYSSLSQQPVTTKQIPAATKRDHGKKDVANPLSKEFIIMLSEFYESLNPIQRRIFERERKGMKKEQFQAYVNSIMKRKKEMVI